MITRRRVVVLSAKGVAALMASAPFLEGCAGGRSPMSDDTASEGVDTGDASSSSGLTGSSSSSSQTSPSGPIDWDAFLVQLSVLADTQFSSGWDHEAYVDEVRALMSLLDLDDDQFQSLYDGYADAAGNFPELNTVHEKLAFEVATVEFEPGDTIPLHNHPDMTGVIFCLSGQVEIDSFDLLDALSDRGSLLMQRTALATVVPGEFSTLTGERGNIHGLVATEYTELLDVFTPPYDAERLTRYRWYERAEEPYEGDDVFEVWET